MRRKQFTSLFSATEDISIEILFILNLVALDFEIQRNAYLDIYEIFAIAFYKNIRNRRYKLFTLTLNKISLLITFNISRKYRIKRNNLYLYRFQAKFKKYYEFANIVSSSIQTLKLSVLSKQNIKNYLLYKYYDFLNVFDRTKTNNRSLYRSYNY